MFKHRLAALALSSSIASLAGTSLVACDRRPPIIQLPASSAAEVDRPGQMTVTGQATLEVSPDCADLTLTIVVDDARPGGAVKQLDARKLAMIAALGKIGVETKDLKLSSLQLDPQYEYPTAGNWSSPRLRGYRAQITVTATTKDFSKIGDIMDAAASAGATSMSSAFRRSDLPELKKQVRDMALAAAKAKAEQTAKALGIHVGRVVSVAENQGGVMWHQAYFPQAANIAQTHDASGGSVSIGGSLQPLTLDVTIGFELAKQT